MFNVIRGHSRSKLEIMKIINSGYDAYRSDVYLLKVTLATACFC